MSDIQEPSEPPETQVDDQSDEEDGQSSHLGISRAGVEVAGIATILFGQGWQIAGSSVYSLRVNKEGKHICRQVNE